MSRISRHIQPRIPGAPPRVRLSPRVAVAINRAVERLAIRFNCSKSFIVAVTLAKGLDVPLSQEEQFTALISRPRPFRPHRKRPASKAAIKRV